MSDAILFISFGGPDKSEDVMPFLEIVTRGRGIPRERLLGVAAHYEHLGGKSPVNEITRRQADALRAVLEKKGDRRPVYLGQRNWHPFLEDVIRRMRGDGITTATAFCTAPYRSEASLERYAAAVAAARAAVGSDAPEIRFVGPWFDHPLFIDAVAARARAADLPPGAPVVFTAHSIPCCLAKDSVYVEELRAAASLAAARLGVKDWRLAFTSRSGNPRDPWLEPDISKVIAESAAKNLFDLSIIPIGFVADHVEVLYDLDIEAKAAADKLGVRLHRAQTVGDHPLFIDMIADMVRHSPPADQSLAVSSASTHFRAGGKAEKVGVSAPACFCFPDDPNPPCRRAPPSTGRPK